ncbi:uncharacterized protein SPAPADRAFT_70053 [Spathaspora passalidarum NRRL Y-27907]|uniref:Lysophospholipase n=1 Tax=Spathaspora passalidarum (strain NRRL Y-27907 / 11-Y1) TaxID=619300 RepID=G3AIX0_SPAPN|nr:uncharacterized protein SPAPADRAFT_70053 [Spathaspora passalidarum NRRL Y-27907]EGW33781.1 hypothetical protein SPAPADRAFT_70053 [Spathaspora passalidarum NRRL Y-27907]
MFHLVTLLLFNFCLISAWSPTDSYAPGEIACPKNYNGVRLADQLSNEESDWIQSRNEITDKNLIEFLNHANMDDFDAENFITGLNRSIKIGLAFSGGGYRAMLCGAGQFSALDNRTRGAWEHGLGGLVQASTYMVGLSGGNWMVGTIAMNNFTHVEKIIEQGTIWDLSSSIINPGGWKIWKTASTFKSIDDDLDDKKDAGFELSLTDFWGRSLSSQFFAGLDDFGAALTWSNLQNADVFTNHEMPFPIVVSLGREPGTLIVSINSTLFEFNPYEMGSWDPTLYQFTPVKYLGTEYNNGNPVNDTCIGGFDNAGFIMGTSSTLFNQFLLQINTTSIASTVKSIITTILKRVSHKEDDIAIYRPNPFYNTSAAIDKISKNDTLFLVDGGEDLQNIPLAPLLQPERDVDVIFAFDNSADTEYSWPNGTSMIATFERQYNRQGVNASMFPYVPDSQSFINLNLTSRPAFFGCDSKNLSTIQAQTHNPTSAFSSPLIVYTANRPFSYSSNTSTFKMSYENGERDAIIQNGFEVASRNNMTLDDEWRACVGCAIIRREQERQGQEQSEQCKQCFAKYCWDGSLDRTSQINANFTDNGSTEGHTKIAIRSLCKNYVIKRACSITMFGNKDTGED